MMSTAVESEGAGGQSLKTIAQYHAIERSSRDNSAHGSSDQVNDYYIETIDKVQENNETEIAVSASTPVITEDNLQKLEESTANVVDHNGSKTGSKKRRSPNILWNQLNFQVKQKKILTDCWGEVKSGQVCAIMGPSGSGKTSLLNILAGRTSSHDEVVVSGNVFVGGYPINPVAFRRHIAYVAQDDVVLATSTVREALEFSAALRLPNTFSTKQIDSIVESLLDDLDLQSCADTLIGGGLIKSISGGEMKRTCVGVELITDPPLLFLDEPTSGLDSYSSFSLIKLLKKVALRDCTILCSIHQPSSEVFFLFDQVIFMRTGKIFYQGDVNRIVGYYQDLNYYCPTNYNPADYVMMLAKTLKEEEIQRDQLYMTCPEVIEQFGQHDDNASVNSGGSLLSDMHKFNSMLTDPNKIQLKAESSLLRQFYWLSRREILSTIRDKHSLMARFGITIILNLLFGLIFYQAAQQDDSDPNKFSSHYGGLTIVFISSLTGTSQQIMLSFPYERPMFLREYSTGTYGAIAYFVSKLITELPLTFLQILVQFILVYFLIGFQGNFILLVLAAWGLGASSCSVAVALGCSVAEAKKVTEMMPLLFIPQLLFAGFFIRTSQIPEFLRWAQYLCSLKYAMNLGLIIEFDQDNEGCSKNAVTYKQCNRILEVNDISRDDFYIYIIVLFILFAGFRIIGAITLVQKAKKFY